MSKSSETTIFLTIYSRESSRGAVHGAESVLAHNSLMKSLCPDEYATYTFPHRSPLFLQNTFIRHMGLASDAFGAQPVFVLENEGLVVKEGARCVSVCALEG